MSGERASLAPTQELTDLAQDLRRRFGGEPGWHLAQRQAALAQYQELPIPVRQRTPLRPRRLEAIPYHTEAAPDLVPEVYTVAPEDMAHAVFSNGRLASLHVPQAWMDAGVQFLPLAQALTSHADLVEPYLGTVQVDDEHRYTAWNRAFWTDGLFVYVPPRVTLDQPLSFLHWVGQGATGVAPRTLVVAGRESRANVLEMLVGSADDLHRVLLSSVLEVVAEDGAEVGVSALQQLAPGTDAFIARKGRAARDARIDWHTAEFGAGLVVSGHHTLLAGAGSRSASVTVFFGSGHQHQDYTAGVTHEGLHTTSAILARGVMKDRARSIFTGVSEIKKGARGTDARQKEQTLMLSPEARADAIPSLLIEENDVFAAHSASAGPVDDTVLYYLQSRGITEDEAVRLVVRGFLEPAVSKITLPPVQKTVREAVDRKLDA